MSRLEGDTTQERISFRRRLIISLIIVLLCSTGLALRWAFLQVYRFEHFAELSLENRITVLPIAPVRGLIYDRHGQILAENAPRYSLVIGSDYAKDVLEKIDDLQAIIDLPPDSIERLEKAAKQSTYSGEVMLRDFLEDVEVATFVAWQYRFPEVVLKTDFARRYPLFDSAAHVIGNVGRISDKDVQRLKKKGRYELYRGSDYVGKTGMEVAHENVLQGLPGIRDAEIDAHGRILNSIRRREPREGKGLYLTIDYELQQYAEELLRDRKGSIVALDVHTGEVLALASSPRFDINQFVSGLTSEEWKELNTSSAKPLVHRAIGGQYAPGSTLKPFLALAALENEWRDSDYSFFSRGYFELGGRHRFHDWKAGGHGEVDFVKSIVRSVNTFYYSLAHEVGIEGIHDALAVFGFGAKTGIDISGEQTGVLPNNRWKSEVLGEPWYPGDTISIGVGQGYLQVTPLQMACAIAMIANGGRRVSPKLTFGVQNLPSSSDADHSGNEGTPIFSEHNLSIVQKALEQVTLPGGTAYSVGKNSLYPIAGKTGTAQVSSLKYEDGSRVKNEDLPEHLRDHAWFVGYGPAQWPQIAVVALVENGGSGGRVAGPLVRLTMDKYLLDILDIDFSTAESYGRSYRIF